MQIDPEALREAAEVTAHGSAGQLELQLGHLCNNRCVFCTSGQLSELHIAKQIAADPVLHALDEAASRGVKKVTFLGGEPTLQRSFLPALQHAVDLGFEEIVIFTNGVTSAHRPFLDRLLNLGDFTWRFSIQGGTEEAHDAATQMPGSFARIIAGLAYLSERGQRITANMCVNERSYRSLPHYPELVRRFGIRDLHIDMVRPAHAGARTDEYLRDILPRFTDMVPYFRTMLAAFEEWNPGFDINVGNLPYCVMPEWAHRIHHGGESTTIVSPDEIIEDKYANQWSDMRHPPQCEECVFRTQCRGVPAKYLDFYGDGELRPITRDDLPSLRGHFVLKTAPLLEPVLRDPPPPWTVEKIFRATRDDFVEVTYAARGRATVTFTPPGVSRGGERLWSAPQCEVAIAYDRLDDLRALIRWLAQKAPRDRASAVRPPA